MDSKAGTFSAKKSDSFADWYNEVLSKAQIVDNRYPVKGMPVMLPNGCFMHDKIMRILEKRWEERNIRRCLFPIAIPYDYLAREAEHVAGFTKECYWISSAGDQKLEKPFALRPTSETAMYSMFALWIRSYADLPLKVYQTVSVYRYETKSTKPLIRVREIPWNEAHCAFPDAQTAVDDLHAAVDIYRDIIENKLLVRGVVLQRPEWDRFAGAVFTIVIDIIMPCGRVLQSAGLHYLGTKFASAFGIKYLDAGNGQQMPHMTCYGVSTRLLAAALSIPGDDNGLVVSPEIAPYQVVVIAISSKNEEDNVRVREECQRIAEALKTGNGDRKRRLRVLLDVGSEAIGPKYYRHELNGVPVRLELGARDLKGGHLMISDRKTKRKERVPYAGDMGVVLEAVEHSLTKFTESVVEASKEFHESHIATCTTLEEAAERIKKVGGFVRVPFFLVHPTESIDESLINKEDVEKAKECDDRMRELCLGEIRGFCPYDKTDDLEGLNCIFTGEPAKSWVYIARAY